MFSGNLSSSPRGGRLVFRRWQVDARAGRSTPSRKRSTGSRDRAITPDLSLPYRGGKLFPLPLAWYSQTRSWGWE